MNIDEIKALVQLFEASSLSELSLGRDGAQLTLKRDAGGGMLAMSAPAPTVIAPAQPDPAPYQEASTASPAPPAPKGHAITSPLVGTFYRRPSPDDPPYVEVGAEVKKGDTLCIIEAMKVMNEIKADANGKVLDVLVEDGTVVEYGQSLIAIDPQ